MEVVPARVSVQRDQWYGAQKETIPPAIICGKVGKERLAGLFKIEVSEEYNQFQSRRFFYAPKHYTDEGNEFYEDESRAYDKIINGHPNTLDSMIGYYGCFKYAGPCNVILKFAHWGTFEDYLRNFPPPMSAADGNTFWRNFLRLAWGVQKSMNLEKSTWAGIKTSSPPTFLL